MDETRLVRAKALNEQVCEIILEHIITGKLRTGDRVNIRQLESALKVSRSPVKDALVKLHGSGLIDISRRKGYCVRALAEKELTDLFEFRLILEVEAAKKAVHAITAEVCHLLESEMSHGSAITEARNAVDAASLFKQDRNFHCTIVKLAGNDLLTSTHSNVHLLSHAVRTQYTESKERAIRAQEEHRAIFEALRKKDSVGLERAITEHLRAAEHELRRHISRDEAAGRC